MSVFNDNFPKILTAKIVLSKRQKIFFILLIVFIMGSLIINASLLIRIFLILINFAYFFSSIYKLAIFLIGIKINYYSNNFNFSTKDLNLSQLPLYTLMIPLYKEARIIKQLVENMKAFDYPKEKLQILIVLEDRDLITINAFAEIKNLPPFFNIIKVPASYPQTKAKACNYALKFAKGKIIGIYDAEDQPDRDQLKKIVHKFNSSPKDLVCVQCRLQYYNSNENWLTNMFEIEYRTLFSYVLPTISSLRYPIPLGGSSNHFNAQFLKDIKGWDPYNITEDADLGIKLSLLNYKTTIINSYTHEEAPISINAWVNQRTRWLRGYMHTFLVYARVPSLLRKRFSFSELLFLLYIFFIGPFLSLASPFAFVLLLKVIDYDVTANFSNAMTLISWANLLLGISCLIFTSYVAKDDKTHAKIKYFWSYPLYFNLHIIAAFLAIYRLFKSPHKWEKTEHGVSRLNNE